ncbi:WD40 repeat domain-containing protein [Micromonospora deserti]|uniref:WD40 repeat domain-containing protein n=1 Tax=Micromonospora deserti TaxID=2070366 RepID=UPI0011B630BF|nr:WD40 repeat domain-containing protein [Micromonospora deserti]
MNILRWMVVSALVPFALTACGSPPEPTRFDGTDTIVEQSASAAPPAGRAFDQARRVMGGAHISPDGRFEARVDADGRVEITSTAGGQFDWFDSGSGWGGMDFSPDGRFLAVGVFDSVILYDFTTKNPTAMHSQHLVKVRFSADSSYLVTEEFIEDRNGKFVLFDVRTGRRLTSPQPPYIEVQSDPGRIWWADELAVFDGGKHVVAAGDDGFLLWSTRGKTFEWVPCGCLPTSAAVDREARHVAFVIPEGEVSLWDVASRREISRWRLPKLDPTEGPSYAGADVMFTEDGKWLLTHFLEDGQVWSVSGGTQVGSWEGTNK